MAIGDFNNDEQLDVVVVHRAVDRISIYLASNNGTFQKPTIYPTGLHSQPNAVAVAHLTNDQQLDIVVACFGTNNIAIFLGMGDGSFVNHKNISTRSSRPLFIHVAYLDNDTFLDLVTADYGTDSITVFAGDGTGSFEYAMSYSTGYDSLPVSVISGDLDDDHWIDLVVAHSGTNSIGIFFGRANGTFFEQTILSAGKNSHPSSIAVGYFNGDLLLDLAVANFGSNSTGVFLNTGNGTFAPRQSYELGDASPYFIDTEDVNNDKRVDLIVTNRGGSNIGVFSGCGNGSFGAPTMYSTGSRSSIAAVVRDLNRDNLLDIIVVHNDTKSVDIFLGKDEGFQWETKYSSNKSYLDIQLLSQSDSTSDGNTTKAVDYAHRMRQRRQFGQDVCEGSDTFLIDYITNSLVIADLNNDTYLDVIVGYIGWFTIGVYFGLGNGSFRSQNIKLVESDSACVLVMDWNNDGVLDMIFAGSGNYALGMLVGLGNRTYTQRGIHSTTARFCPKIIVDLNGDGRLDLIATEMSTNEAQLYVFLINESGILPDPIVYSSEASLQSLAVGDVDNDGQPDLIVLTDDDYIHMYLGSRNGTFANPIKYGTIAWASDMMLGHLDNDTYLDLVVVDYSENSTIAVLLGYGNGSFADPILHILGSRVTSPRVVDVNNDGLLDLITIELHRSKLRILFGNGHGSFARQITCSTGASPYTLGIEDLDGDTRLDIVVPYRHELSISVFLSSPMQFSTDAIPLASNKGSRLSSIVVEDFNHDHILDIVVANYGTKTIGLLLGRGDGSFREQFTFPLDPSSNPFSITVGDFNNDKQLDLAVANSGSTKIDLLLGDGTGMFMHQKTYGYTLKQTPSMILADDLNNDGESELIVVYENSDDIDIYVAYDTGNFTTHTIYPTSIAVEFIAVGDFNNDTFPDVVVVSHYGTNMSIVFGTGNGSFSNEKIYSIGYRTDSIDVSDLNNDTFVDIVLVHSEDSTISILLSRGNDSFLHSTIPMTLQFGTQVRVYYVNDDFAPDIIIFEKFSSDFEVFLGHGNGSFMRGMNQTVDPGLLNEAAGDLNNDGYIDAVTTLPYRDQLIIKLGFGNGTFVEQPRRRIPCSPIYARLGDLNKDNKLDIVVSSHKNQTISVLLGYGDGSFTAAAALYAMEDYPDYSVFADLNNDDQMDIIVVTFSSENFIVFLGDSNVGFIYQKTLMTGNGSRPRAFATGDFNNDTHRDIAVINSANHTLGIFLGHGNRSFSNQRVYPTGASPSLMAVGDLNNDHYLDIVIIHSDDSIVSIHLGDGTGSFPHRTTFSIDVDSQPKSVVLVDFDNDGLLDIIIANYVASNVIVLIGLGNGHFISAKELRIGYGTHPFAIGVGDFNSDHKLDFALVNYGSDNVEIHLQTC